MKMASTQSTERLTRVRTTRRGVAVELRVHYEIVHEDGFDSIRLLSIEDAE